MERLSMSKTKEILRLRWALGLSVRETSRACGASTGVVSKTVNRATRAGLTWEVVDALEEPELERRLYGGPKFSRSALRAEPDPAWIHCELRRAGVTLELLHLEYLAEHPDGYRYTAFCERYRRWLERQAVVMRQVHRAGEKAFVDYSGKKPHFVDPLTDVPPLPWTPPKARECARSVPCRNGSEGSSRRSSGRRSWRCARPATGASGRSRRTWT